MSPLWDQPSASTAAGGCGACQEACPVFIEHPAKILQMRQNLVLSQEKVPADLARTFRNIERNPNPWGIGADKRMEWAEGLGVPTIEEHPQPEYILWVGCAGAFDQRIAGIDINTRVAVGKRAFLVHGTMQEGGKGAI